MPKQRKRKPQQPKQPKRQSFSKQELRRFATLQAQYAEKFMLRHNAVIAEHKAKQQAAIDAGWKHISERKKDEQS
jgi:hypothetical protein